MRPNNRPLALLIALGLSCTALDSGAKVQKAQVLPQPSVRVVSVTEDTAGNFVLLATQNRKQMPRPVINYLPGLEGRTIMSADFAGTVLCSPRAFFRFPNSPVTQLHVGQLQASPPIVRVCLESKDRDIFNRVDFRSSLGSLIIKLPSGVTRRAYEAKPAARLASAHVPATPTTPVMPPVSTNNIPHLAPDFARRTSTIDRRVQYAPAFAPDNGATVTPVDQSKQSETRTRDENRERERAARRSAGRNSVAETPAETSSPQQSVTAPKPAPSVAKLMPLVAPSMDPNAPRLRGEIPLSENQMASLGVLPRHDAGLKSTEATVDATKSRPAANSKIITSGDATYTLAEKTTAQRSDLLSRKTFAAPADGAGKRTTGPDVEGSSKQLATPSTTINKSASSETESAARRTSAPLATPPSSIATRTAALSTPSSAARIGATSPASVATRAIPQAPAYVTKKTVTTAPDRSAKTAPQDDDLPYLPPSAPTKLALARAPQRSASYQQPATKNASPVIAPTAAQRKPWLNPTPPAIASIAATAMGKTQPLENDETEEAEPKRRGGFGSRFKHLFGFGRAKKDTEVEETTDTAETPEKNQPVPVAPAVAKRQLPPARTMTATNKPKVVPAVAMAKPLANQISRTRPAHTPRTALATTYGGMTAAQSVFGVSSDTNPPVAPDRNAVVSGCPLQIIVGGRDPLCIKLVANRPVQVNSFRLHDPDRYVCDISGLEYFDAESMTPELPENPWIKAIRVGRPDGENGVMTRVVVDLCTQAVGINDAIAPDKMSAAITLQSNLQQNAFKPGLVAPERLPPGYSVVLDAGHGGTDPGAQRGDVREKELTLSIVEKLKKQLQSRGVQVRMTRSDDTFVSLEDRVKITNALQPSAFVSVHINAMETNTGTHGIETYFLHEGSKDLAQLIHGSLVKELQAPDRSVRKARFYVINHTPVPAVLAEVGFISNRDERDKLTSSDYQTHVANALADGVMLYLAGHGQGRAFGTISACPPSATRQSFTQNLHSPYPAENKQKTRETGNRRRITVSKPSQKQKPKLFRQSLKFKRQRLASRRS